MAIVINGPPKRKLYNLTPHAIRIHCQKEDGLIYISEIPSDGDLRLTSLPQLHVERGQMMDIDVDALIITGQAFDGLDVRTNGFNIFTTNPQAAFIVSLPVAQWLVANPNEKAPRQCTILTPATGPQYAVRNDQGQIIGCKALELHYKPQPSSSSSPSV